MREEDLVIGMKVKIPKTKSVYGPISTSIIIKRALEANQDYLYFAGIEEDDGCILLDNEKNTHNGDFFLLQDIELYEEEKPKEQELIKNPMYTIKELEERKDLVIYLDSQEEFNKLKTITKKLTIHYYGKHCYSLYKRNYSAESNKNNAKGYDDVNIIVIDQIKELNMEEKEQTKEIIGYKLIKPEYFEAASMIVFGNKAGSVLWRNNKVENRICHIDKLKKAGVLDLWFEPVFFEEETFKIGDWVSFYSESRSKIITSQIKDWTAHSYCKLKNGSEPFKSLIRKATPEEIKNVTEVVIVLSNNHKVTIGIYKIIASNREIDFKSIKKLMEPLGTLGNTSWTINIESIKIGCWENVTRKDLQLIIDTYEEING
jgi:hypothetical protein